VLTGHPPIVAHNVTLIA